MDFNNVIILITFSTAVDRTPVSLMVTAISSSRCLSCLGPKHRGFCASDSSSLWIDPAFSHSFLDSGLVDPISFRDFLSFDSCIVRFDDLCAKLWYVLCVLCVVCI